MASPFTWDLNKPAGSDALNIGDDQIRTDKTTLRNILRSLVPFGTTNLAWRQVQISNDSFLALNASYDGTNWNRDDTAVVAVRIQQQGNGDTLIEWAPSGSNPIASWITVAGFQSVASAVNFLNLINAAAGGSPELQAVGTDENIGVRLVPKGTGDVEIVAPAGQEADLAAVGADADINLRLKPKGNAAAQSYLGSGGPYVLGLTLDKVIAQVAVDNTLTETSVYSISIPANLLGTDRGVFLTLWGEASNDNVDTPITLRVKYGATTVITHAVTYNNNNAAGVLAPLLWQVLLIANGATNTQTARSWFDFPGSTGAPVTRAAATGTAAEDSTAAKTFNLTVQWGTAVVNNRFRREAVILTLV